MMVKFGNGTFTAVGNNGKTYYTGTGDYAAYNRWLNSLSEGMTPGKFVSLSDNEAEYLINGASGWKTFTTNTAAKLQAGGTPRIY